MGVGIDIFILAVLLFLSGFFSGSEVALVSLTDAKVKDMLQKKRYGAKYVALLKANPQKMLSTILIGNNIMNIWAASLMTVVMITIFDSYAVGIATGVMTLLILVFGEITPKAMAAQNPEKFARKVSPIIWFFGSLIAPVLSILDWFLTKILRLLGIRPQKNTITEDEIRHIVSAAQEEGSIKKLEKDLIINIFEFDNTTVGEVSTPNTDMVMVSNKATVGEALEIIGKKKHSRLPVYQKYKDNIVGVLYLRDLLRRSKSVRVDKVMKQTHFVPASKKIGTLLRSFQQRKEHMSIVVDEHGSIVGLITLEDVLEELVGDIVDEAEEFEENIKRMNKTTWLVKGKTEIEEVNKELKMRIPDGDYETVGGFILQRIGHIPKKGHTVKYGKFTMIVEDIRKHRIWTIKVNKK